MELDNTLQPHLGRVTDNYKPQLDMTSLAIAKVTKVHHKHHTVDLQVIKSNSTISSDSSSEGKYSARVMVAAAHYDPQLASSSGIIEPLQEGQLVLLAFVDGLKHQPIILGSFHQTWETEHNILPDHYPLTPEDSMEDKRDAIKSLKVHPSQFYQRIDGIGSMEMSHPSKTFLQVDPDLYGEIGDGHREYDHINLNEKDPFTGKTRSGRTEESSYPVNVLFVHRSNFDDQMTTWSKLFIDKEGMIRLTRDNNDNKLTYVEMPKEGGIKIRRQLDSNEHGGGSNYSESGVDESGSPYLSRAIDGAESKVSISSNGDIVLSHKDGPELVISANSAGGMVVAEREDPNWPDGTLWIDTSN